MIYGAHEYLIVASKSVSYTIMFHRFLFCWNLGMKNAYFYWLFHFSGDHKQKFYWGHKEILIPVYKHMSDAIEKHPDADVVVNFASLRSAEEATMDILKYQQIKCIAIIAEGIPENKTKKLNKIAKEKGVVIIGPATVGGIKPGCFKIGNTGGMLDNILDSKLYRPGSVAYVSRSGGMSNELNNIICRNTNGVFEGCAIGGDRYPGSTFTDHLLRYHAESKVKMLVLLGEIGGTEEYEIIKAKQAGHITKPVVAWCIGTCAKLFGSDVQFGHAGASANADAETALAKNSALRNAGFIVPDSFDGLAEAIGTTYSELVDNGTIVPEAEVPPPTVPMDYNWARELGLIRKPASFMSSVSDERGHELQYAGIPISKVFEDNMGIGGVLSLLWFQKRLPEYAGKFFEMCLMITGDHGPAVSGAHNTIVCARAGKDLVSSLTSGLLTIVSLFFGHFYFECFFIKLTSINASIIAKYVQEWPKSWNLKVFLPLNRTMAHMLLHIDLFALTHALSSCSNSHQGLLVHMSL